MKTVNKYIIRIIDDQTFTIPACEILSVQMQRGLLCMWAKVDTLAPIEKIRIIIRGTGHPLPSGALRHIATIQDDTIVWHVFQAI
jgi:hypothetical protein